MNFIVKPEIKYRRLSATYFYSEKIVILDDYHGINN